MKVLIVLSAILVAAVALPAGGYGPAVVSAPALSYGPVAATHIYAPAAPPMDLRPIVTGSMHASQDTAGQYDFGYSSSDGQSKKESKPAGGDVEGQFSYTSPEGQNVHLQYTAGEGGFVAAGDHLPRDVELPEELAAAYAEAHARLEKAHEEARLRGDVVEDDGQYREEQQVVYAPVHAPAPVHYAPAPVHYAPAPVHYAPAPAPVVIQAPAVKQVHYAAAIPSVQYAPAPAPVKTYVKAEAPSAPAPYSSSSYQTELGGPVAAPQVVLAAPSHHQKSSYSSNGY